MRRTLVWTIAAVAMAAACSGADSGDTSGAETATGAASESSADAGGEANAPGTISFGDRTFTFQPSTCVLSEEDSEVNGPGREEGGDVVFVDFSGDGAGEAGIRIELGTDQPFETAEQHVAADRYVSEPLAVTIDGSSVRASGEFRDEHDDLHDGELSFTC